MTLTIIDLIGIAIAVCVGMIGSNVAWAEKAKRVGTQAGRRISEAGAKASSKLAERLPPDETIADKVIEESAPAIQKAPAAKVAPVVKEAKVKRNA